jgi:hypothetical protein
LGQGGLGKGVEGGSGWYGGEGVVGSLVQAELKAMENQSINQCKYSLPSREGNSDPSIVPVRRVASRHNMHQTIRRKEVHNLAEISCTRQALHKHHQSTTFLRQYNLTNPTPCSPDLRVHSPCQTWMKKSTLCSPSVAVSKHLSSPAMNHED